MNDSIYLPLIKNDVSTISIYKNTIQYNILNNINYVKQKT